MVKPRVPIAQQAKTSPGRNGTGTAYVTVGLPVDWIEEIDAIAVETYLTRSDIIRAAIREYLEPAE